VPLISYSSDNMPAATDAEVVIESNEVKKTSEDHAKDIACNAFVSTINSPYFWILVGVVGTVVFKKLCEKFDE